MKKPRSKRTKTNYKPVFTAEEFKLMQAYGVGTLVDEIGLNRVMLLRLMHKMNQESEHLSFRDHLNAVRVVAYTTGHITRQVALRENLFKPYQEIEKQYKEYGQKLENIAERLGKKLVGQEKWGDLIMDEVRKKLDGQERKSKT